MSGTFWNEVSLILFYPLNHTRCLIADYIVRTEYPQYCAVYLDVDVSPCLCADPCVCTDPARLCPTTTTTFSSTTESINTTPTATTELPETTTKSREHNTTTVTGSSTNLLATQIHTTMKDTTSQAQTSSKGGLLELVTADSSGSTTTSLELNNTSLSQNLSDTTRDVTDFSISFTTKTSLVQSQQPSRQNNSISATALPLKTSIEQMESTENTLPGLFPFPGNIVTKSTTTFTKTTVAEISLVKVPWHRQVVGRELFPVEMMLAVVCIVLLAVLMYLQFRIRRVKKKTKVLGIYATIESTSFLPLTMNRGTQHSKTGVDLTTSASHDYTIMQPSTIKSDTDLVLRPISEREQEIRKQDGSECISEGTEMTALDTVKPASIISGHVTESNKQGQSHVEFAETDISDYYPRFRSLDQIREEKTKEAKERENNPSEHDHAKAPQITFQDVEPEQSYKVDNIDKQDKQLSASTFKTARSGISTASYSMTKKPIKARSETAAQKKYVSSSSSTTSSKLAPKSVSKSIGTKSSLNSSKFSKSTKLSKKIVKKPTSKTQSNTSSVHTFKPYLTLIERKDDEKLKKSGWLVSTDDITETTDLPPLVE